MRIIKGYKELEYRLKREMKRGRLLDTSQIERRIGKSYLLNEIAKETRAYIITPYRHLANAMNKNFNTDRFIAIGNINNLRGMGVDKKYLLEELLKPEDEKKLRKYCNIIGGYSSYGLYSRKNKDYWVYPNTILEKSVKTDDGFEKFKFEYESIFK